MRYICAAIFHATLADAAAILPLLLCCFHDTMELAAAAVILRYHASLSPAATDYCRFDSCRIILLLSPAYFRLLMSFFRYIYFALFSCLRYFTAMPPPQYAADDTGRALPICRRHCYIRLLLFMLPHTTLYALRHTRCFFGASAVDRELKTTEKRLL